MDEVREGAKAMFHKQKTMTTKKLIKLCVLAAIALFISAGCETGPPISTAFPEIMGEWKLIKFEGTAIQSHIDPFPDGYDPTEEEVEAHNALHLNTIISIDDSTINSFNPGSELGYYCDDMELLFFGYKPPVALETPVLYVRLQHCNFSCETHFLMGADGEAVIDIDGFFYRLENRGK